MLLNILQYTAQSPVTKNCPTQNISSAVDKKQTLVLWWGEGGSLKVNAWHIKKKKKENGTPKPSPQWLFAFKNIDKNRYKIRNRKSSPNQCKWESTDKCHEDLVVICWVCKCNVGSLCCSFHLNKFNPWYLSHAAKPSLSPDCSLHCCCFLVQNKNHFCGSEALCLCRLFVILCFHIHDLHKYLSNFCCSFVLLCNI